jgi:hypothetical protein
VTQQARSPLMDLNERAQQFRFLIRDRDRKFIDAFDHSLRSGRHHRAAHPSHTPKANTFAGTVYLERPPRVHRPATDLLPTPSGNRPEDLRRPLQRPSPASFPGPTPAPPVPCQYSRAGFQLTGERSQDRPVGPIRPRTSDLTAAPQPHVAARGFPPPGGIAASQQHQPPHDPDQDQIQQTETQGERG